LDFIEVHVATPLAECEERDTKGLYAKVKAGANIGLSGVNAPYEAPTNPEFVLCAKGESVDQCVEELIRNVLLRCDLKR
jgi:bifunctional enzyme CysN/CysC